MTPWVASERRNRCCCPRVVTPLYRYNFKSYFIYLSTHIALVAEASATVGTDTIRSFCVQELSKLTSLTGNKIKNTLQVLMSDVKFCKLF